MPRDLAKSTKGVFHLALLFFALSPCHADSTDADTCFLKAKTEFENHQFDAALFDYSKVIDLEPYNEGAYINRGNIELRQGNLDAALADYDKAIEITPTDEIAYYDRGNLQYAKKNMAEALANYNKAIALDPACAAAYDSRGLVKEGQGDLAGAMEDFNKAIVFEPHLAIAYNNRGGLEQRLGNLDAALADCEQAIKLDTKNDTGTFYNNLAALKLAKANTAGAQNDLKKSADLNPDLTADAYRNRGRAEESLNQWDDSLADFNRAMKLDPRDANIFVDIGHFRMSRGDLSDALAEYDRAISLNPNIAAAYCQRGVAKGMSGDDTGAFADFNKALELNPKYVDVYCSRAFLEWDIGKDNAAMADVNQAIAIAPEFARAYNNRGWLCYDQRKFDDALADFEKSYQLNPRYSEDFSRFCIWLIRARNGHEAQATAELQTWLQTRKPRGTNDWQLKIAQYLTGALSETDLVRAANGTDLRRTNARCAEAWFFVASKQLVEGNEARAKDCFERCRATNARGNFEYVVAAAELKYLSAKPQ